MPTNIDLIRMHLETMLDETGQADCITWHHLVAYCIGYYETITLDHITAIREILGDY